MTTHGQYLVMRHVAQPFISYALPGRATVEPDIVRILTESVDGL